MKSCKLIKRVFHLPLTKVFSLVQGERGRKKRGERGGGRGRECVIQSVGEAEKERERRRERNIMREREKGGGCEEKKEKGGRKERERRERGERLRERPSTVLQ